MNSPITNLIQRLDKEQLTTVCNVTACQFEGIHAANDIYDLLDSEFPLNHGSHKDADSYAMYYDNIVVYLKNGMATGLANPAELIEVFGRRSEPDAIILQNDHLRAEIEFDKCGCPNCIALQER